MNNQKASPWKSIKLGLSVLFGLIVFAYGFQITKVNLEELRSETRQESLVRVTRALANPDLFEYEREEAVINQPFYTPCPENATVPTSDESGAYIVVTPACANPGEIVTVEGFNFAPYSIGPVRFVPGSDITNIVTLGRENAETDGNGHFVLEMEIPDRPSDDVQYIRATIRTNVGSPHLTKTAYDTWEKIVETVFLALLATVFGTLFAVPLSFIAARNLMKPVRSPLTSLSFSLLGWPIGMAVGIFIVRLVSQFIAPFTSNLLVNILLVLIVPALLSVVIRWALPEEDTTIPTSGLRATRFIVLVIATLIGFVWMYQFSALLMNSGNLIAPKLGAFTFLGYFLVQIGDIFQVSIPVVGALAAGSVAGNFFGKLGQNISEKLNSGTVKIINLVSSATAGATVFGLIGWLVEWLYQLGRPEYTQTGPIAIGALLGLLLALTTKPKDTLPTGLVIYYVTRTILNTLRSVEALVMAIVFVIAVGIGPFAGVMALGLHTIVSLAKLYSEQVESIQAGPLEAITATGANRLQTIIYAVVPQIVPPYISYTMYRWDINVRMSTIIGFVGGGGIGFLLQQNINLLNYRAASAQMIAIAIVVSLMDYISSVMREKVV